MKAGKYYLFSFVLFMFTFPLGESTKIIQAPSGWQICGLDDYRKCTSYCQSKRQNQCYCWVKKGTPGATIEHIDVTEGLGAENSQEGNPEGNYLQKGNLVAQQKGKVINKQFTQVQPEIITNDNYQCHCAQGVC